MPNQSQPQVADAETLRKLDKLAKLLDSQFTIPGTKFKLGADALIGLIPGIGDIAGAVLSLLVVAQGVRMGASAKTVSRMLINVAIEVVVGIVPIVGDLFDLVWQANNRNVALLRAELAPPPPEIIEVQEVTPKSHKVVLAILAAMALAALIFKPWDAF